MLKQQATSLNERMKDELEEAKNISETIEQLVKNKSAIDCNRNFVVKIKRHRAVKRPIGDSEKCALVCLNCNFPCLKQCARTEALEIQLSVIMRRTVDQTKELLAESAGKLCFDLMRRYHILFITIRLNSSFDTDDVLLRVSTLAFTSFSLTVPFYCDVA